MMNYSILSCALVAGAMAFLPGAASAQDAVPKHITIATEGDFAPWNLVNAEGKLDGFEIELAKDLCGRIKIECEFTVQSFDGIIPGLLAKKYDAIMSGLTITAKREEVVGFSIPYVSEVQAFAVLKDGDLAQLKNEGAVSLAAPSPESDAALKIVKDAFAGKTIGVQAASVAASFAKEYFKGIATIKEYKSTQDHNLDLQTGRIDAIIASNSTLLTALKGQDGDTMTIVGPKFQGGSLGRGQGVGVRKEDTALAKAFDAAIEASIADGTVKSLSEKWFGVNIAAK
jgi:octopine/nopaline transport system substrate-binding protein